MASEIRVNKIENRSGLGTVTFADTGVDLAGIVTATTFSGSGASLTSLPAAQLSGTLPALSAANLTSIPAANVTGTLPAISGANLTNLPAANVTGTLPAISGANLTNLTAANLTGALPAISAASCTSIPAANIVGLATAGFERSGGFPQGIEMANSWNCSSGFNYQSTTDITSWSEDTAGKIGTGMSNASGIFTFPSTGIYRVRFSNSSYNIGAAANRYVGAYIYLSSNGGSSYILLREQYGHINDDNSCTTTVVTSNYLDVTDTSTTRIKFSVAAEVNSTLNGGSYGTFVEFIRLGDT